jgi:leucyl-tRNA synthetase
MPGWAGSSWYFFRYMDPKNNEAFASKEALHYWRDIDFYLGGSEHATGHLLYFRFWTKVLYDLGYVSCDEPARKLINQGMIQGISSLVARIKNTKTCVSFDILESYLASNKLTENDVQFIYADIKWVNNQRLNTTAFSANNPEFTDSVFICNDKNEFIVKQLVEKMSKSKYNVVNPDDVVAEYGADCFRMYEMFLGPIELSKPWDTQGIDGVSRFLRKLWRLFYNEQGTLIVNDAKASAESIKTLHKTIKKVSEDIERLSFNTCVSTFMIAVNEWSAQKCNSLEVLKPLLILLHPFAPFITEYLWLQCGEKDSILQASYPIADESLLIENAFEYPISVNGKVRAKRTFALDKSQSEIESEILSLEPVQKWMEGKPAKKIIFVKGRMINIVV